MGGGGFYLMHRGWLRNPVFRDEPYTQREAWEYLISEASFRARQFEIADAVIDLKRGELAASVRHLAEQWQWSKTRVSRYLRRLEIASMISRRFEPAATIIGITKYGRYQAFGQVDTPEIDGTDIGTPNGTDIGKAKNSATFSNSSLIQVDPDQSGTDTGTPNGTDIGTKQKEILRKKEEEGGRHSLSHDTEHIEEIGSNSSRPQAVKSNVGTRIFADWQPSHACFQWASEKGLGLILDLSIETEKFRNYWLSATKNAAKRDWNAAWRNWILKSKEFSDERTDKNLPRGHLSQTERRSALYRGYRNRSRHDGN